MHYITLYAFDSFTSENTAKNSVLYFTILQKKLEQMDDASTELMMGSGDAVMLNLGNAFFEIDEEEASEFCDDAVTKMQEIADKLDDEEGDILRKQKGLKAALYGRFGKSINLEDN